MKINFIDLAQQQALIRESVESNIKKVLTHGQYIMGPEVVELEEKLAEFVGVKHCVAVSSGTDALLVAMMALGIGPGDEVVTTPFTFIATGEMIALLGAIPVFVDIDARTYNIDPAGIESAITPRTRAIMPVSLYGQCADMDTINDIASRHGLPVIEDAAQSFGATYKAKRSCALSTIGCTSFFPSKPLGGYGDSGACFTDDGELATKMREIRVHGQERRYYHTRIGINGRMDTLQAAILLAKMALFPDEVIARERIGKRYTEQLGSVPTIITPYVSEECTSVYAQYTILTDKRSSLQERLKQAGIPVAVHYPVSLARQPALAMSNQVFPLTDHAADRVLSLPMHPYLDVEQQDYIISQLV